MQNKHIPVFILALVLMIISVLSFSDDIFSPYVDFGYAKSHPEKTVQIIGSTDKKTIRESKTGFQFNITDDKNNILSVSYNGIKPLNFDHADKVVVIGKFMDNKFIAGKVLVKCPSKYTEKKK